MIIRKERVEDFLNALRAGYRLYAPVQTQAGPVFAPVNGAGEVAWPVSNTLKSAKEVFLPQTETLFTYRASPDGVQLEEARVAEERVLLGVRPCDARSLTMLDKVFAGEGVRDPYYTARRDHTVVMGLACNEPCGTCFCTSLGGSPFGTAGCDLLWVDLGDRYLVRVVTDKGRALVEGRPEFEPAGDADLEEARKLEERAVVGMPKVAVQGVKEKLDRLFNDPLWDRVHEKCLGCGTCTYLCPTCHCFDLTDEVVDGVGVRLRTWDACMYPLFTLHASGHNPRPTQKERFRQRIMHKFKYFVDNFRETACVGCGRCVQHCPVNIDIRSVLAEISGREGGSAR
ncbi:MAG: 4Fe-4S dicluster domain-containing protein [Desulfotomaculales bacterium]